MKQLFRGLALGALLALSSLAANAATYYVSDCQAGAAPGCVAGSDSNAGTSPAAPWKTTNKVRSSFSGMLGGDFIRFAKGGAWTDSEMWGLRNLNSRIATPITFDSYQPTWYAGAAKPLLTDTRDDVTIFAFTGNPIVPNEGYVIRNLELRGTPNPVNANGIFINQGANGLTIDNVTTKDFGIGFYCGDYSRDNTIRNSTVTHSRFAGIFGGCSDWLIENNILDNNGYTPAPNAIPNRNHAIYFGGPVNGASGVTIRGNTMTNSVKFDGVCQGTVIVAHGVLQDVVIEDNLIDESANVGPNKGGCWGIAISPAWGPTVTEWEEKVVIRRNRVINVGGIGIELGACNKCTIENNVIVKTDGLDMIGIQAPGINNYNPNDPAPDRPMGALTIRNNSIYFANTAQQRWGTYGIQVSKGSKHILVSNLIYFADANRGNTCFTGDSSFPALPLAAFKAYDNNLCYLAGGGRYSLAFANLAAARAQGFDVNGSDAFPQLAAVPGAANNYSMALLVGSPAVGAGHDSQSAAKDFNNKKRDAQPDIGAFEFKRK